MKINQKLQDSFFAYENTALGKLVAIRREDQKLIKNYWKKKGKDVTSEIKGHPFIQTDDQDTLKIDFETVETYIIQDLRKFD
jgi:hypothetical protein